MSSLILVSKFQKRWERAVSSSEYLQHKHTQVIHLRSRSYLACYLWFGGHKRGILVGYARSRLQRNRVGLVGLCWS